MDRLRFCCKDFEEAVREMAIIDENTFDHLVGSEGVKLDGWYLSRPTYQQSIQDFTYEQVGVRLNYCPYCGTKIKVEG